MLCYMEPMEIAEAFRIASKRVKDAKMELKDANVELGKLESVMLDLIENEKLPASFSHNGASIYTREEIWASAKDKDHAAVVAVLESLGLVEYLPQTVNSQSLSGYIREFKDESGELVGIPEELLAVLKITKKPRVIAAGLS